MTATAQSKNKEFLKLDLGCGQRKRPGTIGVDREMAPGVDVVADLSKPPLPFAPNTFSDIFCDDILEHFSDLPKILEEIWRVGCPGCRVYIASPYFSSYNAFQDPTHYRGFSFRTMDYFDPESNGVRHKYFQDRFQFSVKKRRICFREYLTPDDRPPFNPFRWIGLEGLVNLFPKIYERFFCWIIPAVEMYYELEVRKD